MAITFILNDEAVNDQTTALQIGDGDDGFTDTDVAYASLPAAFQDYLEDVLLLDPAFPTDVGVATKTNSVTVDATGGSSLTGITFTDSAGGALTGDPLTDDSGLDTVDGKSILLVADGDNTVIGKYDSDGDNVLDAIAFVIFKEDNLDATATHAEVAFHIVTYTAIFHDDDTDPDDAVDLGNSLKLAAAERLELDFADLPSGQNLFGTIAVDKTDLSKGGLLLFPKGALLNAAGTFTNASPTTNTSQGGGAVTIGNSNQMFDAGEGHFFIYVDDPVAASVAGVGLNQNNADDADTIGFSGTLPQTTAQVEIVQVQGNDAASLKITAYDFTFASAVDTNGEARNLVTNPLASATEVNITEVRVLDENGVEVTTGITIDLAGNTAVVTGLQDDYTVEWTAPGHDGVLIEGVAGKYDLGGFNIVNTNAASEFVGQQIVIEDDGPAVSANATALLDDDALPGGNPGGTGDDVDSANTSGTLGHSFGTDGAGSFAFLTTGAPDGFTYELSGSDLLIKQGTTTVVTVTLDTATGAYTVTQNAPIVHAAGSDENNQAFTLNYQVTDGDGDTADGTLAIDVDDDTPTVTANNLVQLDDDALPGGNPGGTGDDVDSANIAGTLGHSFGADGAGSVAFLTTGAPDGFTYELSGSDLLIKQGTTTVVTVALDTATGAYTVTQNAPIVHAAGSDENNQAFTLNYQVTDGDGDTADGTLAIDVDDDTPIFTANIANGVVDFTTISGPNPDDFGGTSISSVTSSLNGSVGADQNDANNESSDGTKTYTFASATIASSAIAGLTSDISADGTTAWFFTDGATGTAGEFDLGIDTLYFSNVLDQAGAGTYTFTVHQNPVPALLELDFADLPSGQNLFGTIAVDKTDLSDGGLLLFPKGALLNAAGTFTNASPTTNTSQGGGAVTIGNSNQMFDAGEGHFFIYVDDPVAASVAGVGLNQNNADDADTIGFSGTLPQTTAQVEIVQVQGNDPASLKITAYDFTFASAVDTNGEARDLVTDPLAVNGTVSAPTSATQVNITQVRVLDGNGVEVEDSDGSTNSASITIDLAGNTAVITGLQDDYTVEWTAPGHDGVLIEGVAGKYDLGGFNIIAAQPTPDQQFDFTVNETDFDNDVVTSNEFSVGVDGTGVNDNDAVIFV